MNRSITRAALAATAAAALVAAFAPALAAAQSARGYYGADGSYYGPAGSYDDCRQERNSRAATGAVVGGLLGAVVGSQVSGHGARTEGSVVGAGVGALGGAAVGSGSANCSGYGPTAAYDTNDGYIEDAQRQERYAPQYPDDAYGADRYRQDDRDQDGAYAPGPYRGAYDAAAYRGEYRDAYRDGYDAGRGDVDNGEYDYDRDFRAVPVAQVPPGAEECRLAESAIYMPDGRVQKRFIRVCRDAHGQYHTVE